MTTSFSDSNRFCTFDYHMPCWQLGTGLKISLAPGTYRITGDELIDGREYMMLEESYRVDVSHLSE